VPVEEVCNEKLFVYVNELLSASDTSLTTKNAVVCLLTAVVNKDGTYILHCVQITMINALQYGTVDQPAFKKGVDSFSAYLPCQQ